MEEETRGEKEGEESVKKKRKQANAKHANAKRASKKQTQKQSKRKVTTGVKPEGYEQLQYSRPVELGRHWHIPVSLPIWRYLMNSRSSVSTSANLTDLPPQGEPV